MTGFAFTCFLVRSGPTRRKQVTDGHAEETEEAKNPSRIIARLEVRLTALQAKNEVQNPIIAR